MSTLNLGLLTPSTPTGLTAYPSAKSVALIWTKNADTTDIYEVWWNSSNTTTGASKLATVADNSYVDSDGLTGGFNNYYWIKAVNVHGTPSGFSTGTGAVSSTTIVSADTAASTVSSASTSVSVTNSSPTVSAYGTWYSAGYASFTAGSNTITSISMYLITTVSSVSSSGSDNMRVWARYRLYNDTAAADVPGATKKVLLYSTAGTFTYGSLSNITNFTETFVSGFRGFLTPGNSYKMYLEVMKEQLVGTPTCTLTVNSEGLSSSSSATVS